VEDLVTHIKANYPLIELDDLPKNFFLFLSGPMLKWFKTDSTGSQGSWKEFRQALFDALQKQHLSYLSLVTMNQVDFSGELKKLRSSDTMYLNTLKSNPLTIYFEEKLKLINQVFPSLILEDAIKLSIAGLTDSGQKKNLLKYRLLEFPEFRDICKLSDEEAAAT